MPTASSAAAVPRSTRTATRKKAASSSVAYASAAAATAPASTSKMTTTDPLKVVANKRNTTSGGNAPGPSTAGNTTTTNTTSSSTTRSSRHRSNKNATTNQSRLADMSLYSQLNVDRKEEHVAFFILPEGLTPATCSQNLTLAFTAANEAKIACKWMSTKDCLAHTPASENVFVMDPFSGPAFDRIVTFKETNQCFLLGPQILKYLISDEPSIDFDFGGTPPVYSVGMKNLLITTTGVGTPIRKDDLSLKITRMFGTESKSLTKGVTHVVADNMLTDKVFKAYETGIPVMTTEWIDAVWKDSQNEVVHAVDEKYVKYACPMFHKLLICVSQVPSGLKEALRNVIEANGGQYSPELVKNKTSVLIVPKPEGDKFKYAQQWRLPCVVPDWVEACKSAGYIKHPADYAVDLVNRINNPPTTSRREQKKKRATGDVVTSTPLNSMVEPPLHGGGRYNESMLSCINGTCPSELPTGIGNVEEDVLKKAADLLKSYSQNIEPFLDGCQIYISKNIKSEDIRKLVNGSGAVRLGTISDRVTHVIVPLDNQLQRAELQQIKELDPRPHLVKIQWLMESAKQGNAINDERFRVIIDSKNLSSLTNMVVDTSNSHASQVSISALVETNKTSNNNPSIPIPSSSNNRSSSKDKSLGAASVAAAASSSKPGSSTTIKKERISATTTDPKTSENKSKKSAEISPPPQQQEMIENNMELQQQNDQQAVAAAVSKSSNEEEEKDEENVAIFTERKFKVVMDDKDEREEVEKALVEYGGEISDNAYDICIVSPIYSPELLVIRPGATLRTKQWVSECIENSTMNGDAQYFHNPVAAFPTMFEILPNIVVAISQYSNSEKEYLSILITAMGGLYQDVFARKTSSAVQRSTHLICPNTDNDKYRAAQRWGTPVVVAEWIVDCFNTQTLRPIDTYDTAARTADSQSTVNYLPRTPKAPASTMRGGVGGSSKLGAAKINNNRDSMLQPGCGDQQQHQSAVVTPKANNGTLEGVFKTPVSKKRGSGSTSAGGAASKKLNQSLSSEEIPMSESFIEYCRTHKTPDVSMDKSYQEWLKLQPKTPTPPPEALSPIIGEHLGFTRAQSRKLKVEMERGGNVPKDDVGILGVKFVTRQSSTPVREHMAKVIAAFPPYPRKDPPFSGLALQPLVGGGVEEGGEISSKNSSTRSKRSSESSPERENESSTDGGGGGVGGVKSKRSTPKRRRVVTSTDDGESGDEVSKQEVKGGSRRIARTSSKIGQNLSTTGPSSFSEKSNPSVSSPEREEEQGQESAKNVRGGGLSRRKKIATTTEGESDASKQ